MKVVLDIKSKEQMIAVWDAYNHSQLFLQTIGHYEKIKIEELELTARALNCLKSENIYTIADLLRTTKQNLLKVPNLGRVVFNQINSALENKGLSLKD